MKLIIAGGRDFTNTNMIIKYMRALATAKLIDTADLSIVSGMAGGADTCGIQISERAQLVLHEFPAKWQRADGSTDRGAGYKRNTEMAAFGDVLLACWDGQSKGTLHMIQTMHIANKPVYILNY